MKLCYLFRRFSTSFCFTKQVQGYSYPHSYRLLLLFSTQQTTPSSSSLRKPVSIYLMERLGFSEVESLAISKRLISLRDYPHSKQVTDLISFEKSDNVITYLQQHCGLDLSQIKKAVSKHPSILSSNVDKTIKPKVNLLQELGFSTSDLSLVLSTNPRLYLEFDLSSAIQALRGIMGSDEDVVKALKGLKWDTAPKITKNLLPNVTMLENEYTIPRDKIRKFLAQVPSVMIARTERLREVLVRVEQKWGISRDSTQFLGAVVVVSGLSDENIESKCQVFRRLGWAQSDVLSLIRNNPNCLGYSEARMKKLLEFYMNELGYEPAYMASRPPLFTYSLENRVLPRHRVLSILKGKELVRADYQLINFLVLTENRFCKKFILPYESNVPELCKAYKFREARLKCA